MKIIGLIFVVLIAMFFHSPGLAQPKDVPTNELSISDGHAPKLYIKSLPIDADKEDVDTQLLLRSFKAYLTHSGVIKPMTRKEMKQSDWKGNIPDSLYMQNDPPNSTTPIAPIVVDIVD